MTMRPTSSMLVKAVVATATLALALAEGAVAQQPSATWFRYAPEVAKTWNISEPSDSPMQRIVRRKDRDRSMAKKRILVLYPRASSAYDIAFTKILDVFEERDLDPEITVVNFAMDDQRGTEAIRLAERSKVDLIFAMGSESTAWLYEKYRGGAIPVVSVCSKDPVLLGQMPDYSSGSKTNFAFTSLNVPIEVQMAYVMQLRPDLKNLAILVDSKNTSAVQTQGEPIAAFARQHGITVLWGAVRNPANAREELAPIVRDAVQAMRKTDPDLSKSLFWVTGSTSVFTEIRTINENAGRVPVVSVVPEIVRAGADTAALAIGISFESNAHLAGLYGVNILGGQAKAGDLKVGVVSPPDIAISFLKAREIGMRVPFSFFEAASFIYDTEGHPVRTVESKMQAQN